MAIILPRWANLDARLPALIERFGEALCTSEPLFDGENWTHICAAARLWNPERNQIVKVWSAKNECWQLPGAHGEGDFDLLRIAQREARRALGWSSDAPLEGGEAVEMITREIGEYWNTPAHLHIEVVFEFWTQQEPDLPRGASWFSSQLEHDGYSF